MARFHRKVKILARFEHPSLVPVYDAGCREGVHYLVMGYVDGEDLGALGKRFHPLPIEYAASYITQAASALGYAHSRGVYHRNVKPSNILVDRQGVVKLIGLGLARIDLASDIGTDADLTGTGAALGTLDYMAPGQIGDAKGVDQRAQGGPKQRAKAIRDRARTAHIDVSKETLRQLVEGEGKAKELTPP